VSNHPEFEDKLKNVEQMIEACKADIDRARERISAKAMESLNADMNTLKKIQARWKRHSVFFTKLQGIRFCTPRGWADDKQATQDAAQRVKETLARHSS
jgi:hypothetical protein